MIAITLIETDRTFEFVSDGHLEDKVLCGVITLAIKGVYAIIVQDEVNIELPIIIGEGYIRFIVLNKAVLNESTGNSVYKKITK